MATKLTTQIALGNVADKYEFLGIHLDLVEDQVTIHFSYLDTADKKLETKTVTGSFTVAGIVNTDLTQLRNKVVTWLKSRGDIN